MKKLLLVAIAVFGISTVQAQQTTQWAGYGQDHVSAPREVKVDLYEVGIQHRFSSGITVGVWTQQGVPNISAPSMNLTAAQVGYTYRTGIFVPYATVAYGVRTVNGVQDNFYQALVGSRVILNEKWYGDTQVRYRNSKDISNFHTNRVQAGVGYNINQNVSVQANYAKVSSDSNSQQYSVYFIYNF